MFHTDDEIKHITNGLLEQTLPKSDWTHAAHFAAALGLIQTWGYEKTKANIPNIIRQYNNAVGTVNSNSEGYHHTITLASLAAAREKFKIHKHAHTLYEITNILMSSAYGRSDWLLKYWSKTNLFSPAARKTWTEPDKRPLPFII